ncbi:MAG: tripartite tricarboxylate transporter substrate-binding protein, partial [Bradyrhizobium sp.]
FEQTACVHDRAGGSKVRYVSVAMKVLVAVAGIAGAQGLAHGQAYPQRPITLIAATAPGGPGDTAARVIAGRMSAILGQQIVIENVPGAGGVTGAARVARAEPDGYTLLIHQTGITIAPALYPKLPFSVEKDFTAVGLVNTSYSFLVGRSSLPANSLRALADWMKDRPAKFAHPGNGTLGHLTTVLFAKSMGVAIDAVPYRGIGPAMNDILGGHVDLLWAGAASAAPLIKAGTIKAYAFGTTKRSPLAPDVPSAGELGYPEVDIPFWHALFAPAATPKPIIDKLNAALRETLADPDVVKAYAQSGVEAFPPDQRTPDAANAVVRSELERWTKIIHENKIQSEP